MQSSNFGMQTLGISESTPRTESRLKSLFWPSIQSGADVDYLGAQGYWVCVIITALTLLALIVRGQLLTAILTAFFCYMSGVGVRERSRFAAIAILFFMLVDTVVLFAFMGAALSGASVVRALVLALLVSNVRATWMAHEWRPESEEAALPPRMNETFGDRFADIFPQWIWPKMRHVYYVYAIVWVSLSAIGAAIMATRTMLH